MSDTVTAHAGVEVRGPAVRRSGDILTDGAVAFVAELQRRFGHRRDELLATRTGRRAEAARTGRLNFLPHTDQIRRADWLVAPAPALSLIHKSEPTRRVVIWYGVLWV
jgi:malate synthase